MAGQIQGFPIFAFFAITFAIINQIASNHLQNVSFRCLQLVNAFTFGSQ
jgi:hypothetical protein